MILLEQKGQKLKGRNQFKCLHVQEPSQSFFLGFLGFLLRDLALQRGQIGALR